MLDRHMENVVEAGLDVDISELVTAFEEACATARRDIDGPEAELPPIERVRRSFALTSFEENALLLALAPMVEPRFGEHIIALKRNVGRVLPDIGIALRLFSRNFAERLAHREAFGSRAALIKNNLVALESARDDNLLELGLRLSPRVQSLLLDEEGNDPQLEGFSTLVRPRVKLDKVILPAKLLTQLDLLVGHYDEYLQRRAEWGVAAIDEGARGLCLLFSGLPGTGKTLLAHALAGSLGRPLLLVDAVHLQNQRGLEGNLDAILREAHLQRALLLFDDCESLFGSRLQGNRELPLLLAALDRFDGIAVLSTNIPGALDPALDRRITLHLDLEVPPPGLRESIWKLHLPPRTPLADDVEFDSLAEKFEFAGGYIRNSVVVALNRALARQEEAGCAVTMDDFEEAARSQVRHRLKQLATHGGTHLTLEDLVLPDDIKAILVAIIAAVRNRRTIFDEWGFGEKVTTGKGLCSLFRGDSGTGKTLAAEIMANELAMPLYRVRIPSIVSKYVGETEKNLQKCFHEAGLAGALLLFDEADSIFSKRIEVSSANDRYSNMEVNLLLQEVERFEGVVILTTNLDAAIDDAFDRRLNFKVDFPFPDASARSMIWRRLIPDRAPVGEHVNYEYLGDDFELSGGCIKNAVIRAAYSAAEKKTLITMELLERSAVQEYRELGKLVPIRRNPWD